MLMHSEGGFVLPYLDRALCLVSGKVRGREMFAVS